MFIPLLDTFFFEIVGLLSIGTSLDRERKEIYQLQLNARDHGSPPHVTKQTLDIYVIDVNDNPPKFDKAMYTARIIENQVPGSLVTSVRATDKDQGNISLLLDLCNIH